MNINKQKLLQIIKEEMANVSQGQNTAQLDPKTKDKQKALLLLNNLKTLAAEIGKERGNDAINKIVKDLQKQQASVFLNQFLKLPTELVFKVNVNNMLNNPYATITNIINGMIKQAEQAIQKKLAE